MCVSEASLNGFKSRHCYNRDFQRITETMGPGHKRNTAAFVSIYRLKLVVEKRCAVI